MTHRSISSFIHTPVRLSWSRRMLSVHTQYMGWCLNRCIMEHLIRLKGAYGSSARRRRALAILFIPLINVSLLLEWRTSFQSSCFFSRYLPLHRSVGRAPGRGMESICNSSHPDKWAYTASSVYLPTRKLCFLVGSKAADPKQQEVSFERAPREMNLCSLKTADNRSGCLAWCLPGTVKRWMMDVSSPVP